MSTVAGTRLARAGEQEGPPKACPAPDRAAGFSVFDLLEPAGVFANCMRVEYFWICQSLETVRFKVKDHGAAH